MTGRTIIRWTLLVLAGLLLMAVVTIGVRGCRFYKTMSPYLSTETIILPKNDYTESDCESIERTLFLLKDFRNQADEQVELSQADINYLITEKLLRAKRIFVSLSDSSLHVIFTLPFPLTKKFINGSTDISCSYNNDTLIIDLSGTIINNTPITDDVEQAIEVFMINYFIENPNLNDFFNALESLKIDSNKLVFEFKTTIMSDKEPAVE